MTSDKRFESKKAYLDALMAELTPTEIVLLDATIYRNQEDPTYYQMYNLGQYDKCWTYVMERRGSLNIESLPLDRRENAAKAIAKLESMKSIGSVVVVVPRSQFEQGDLP